MLKNNNLFLVANWKMNGLKADLSKYDKVFNYIYENGWGEKFVWCLPHTLIYCSYDKINQAGVASTVSLGGQDCHWLIQGSYTGDISAEMLKDLGANYVIVGHCERRKYHFETNEIVSRKATAALEAGLSPIVCVGDSLSDRENRVAEAAVKEQLISSLPTDIENNHIIIAYEPLWSIGSGLIPSVEEIGSMHTLIRGVLLKNGINNFSILYGGSVKSHNIEMVINAPNVDGVLLGGASLDLDELLDIMKKMLKNKKKCN